MQEEERIEIDEGKHIFNRSTLQLKKAHSEIFELKKQDEMNSKNMSEILDMYELSMENARYMMKRYLPLHREMKNI